jgi:hypothetical protein
MSDGAGLTPPAESGDAASLDVFPARKGALGVKEGVEGGVDVDKLLQQVQTTEAEHGASLRRNG